jgi:hypothetical protein
MGAWSQLDSILSSSLQTVAKDASIQNVVDSTLSNIHVILTTNLTGAVDLGGVAHDPQVDSNGNAVPGSGGGGGLLGMLGISYAVQAVNPSDGSVLASAGKPPTFNPVLAGAYAVAAAGIAFLLYRGVRSLL